MNKNETNKFTLKIPSRTSNLGIIREFIQGIARQFGFSDDTIGEIQLAVDEACSNVIKHAYQYDNNKKIDIIVETNGSKLTIIISDRGKGFDPAKLETPEQRLQKHARGGLGIALIKKVMDEVSFDIHPGSRNEVRMVKYIS